jgi:LPXTG-site transpeptidase (sortase) family protein
MQGIIRIVARLVRASQLVSTRKGSFLVLFALMFLGSVAVLAHFDLLPEAKKVAEPVIALVANPVTSSTVATPVVIESPVKIEIPAIKLSASVSNPESTKVEILDTELLKGVVRYPTSAKLGENGNVVIFGHSSYLPVVKNPAYKAFNGIQHLAVGDTITIYSSENVYTYVVQSVAKASADDAAIPLMVSWKMLTLSTCDSFGEKSDRFVVTADFVESHSIENEVIN